ncbi:PREDICTED: uncharacterized protein LOC107193617 [Dufourea novaeangliae]|uniref:Uncharacterized protein n=1 Tax=Dufourea novaeangliae TaxID=178035 RepID=A0A154P131_DUFNO|nr:PREDICTED: uncharacterized protein LOC107193617 [Dufourea novaeangliae]KZC05054.1 hypothetical protein WN55_08659 [Dufourea novaeangliae]
MEKITHLWNVNQFITKLNCPQSINLQTYYIQKCRRLSQGIELPTQNFGSSVMCPYCGSLWNTVDHSIRILRGKPLSKSIRKIVSSMNNNDKSIPKVRRSLVQKCLKNKMNRLLLRCSVCSSNTKIPFTKPQREKTQKSRTESIQVSQKRKKRRTKDKTAGLNISGILNVNAEKTVEKPKETTTKKIGGTTNFITPIRKIKKLNINRLKAVVTQGATPPKRRSLHNFLTELC